MGLTATAAIPTSGGCEVGYYTDQGERVWLRAPQWRQDAVEGKSTRGYCCQCWHCSHEPFDPQPEWQFWGEVCGSSDGTSTVTQRNFVLTEEILPAAPPFECLDCSSLQGKMRGKFNFAYLKARVKGHECRYLRKKSRAKLVPRLCWPLGLEKP
eukprot:1985665-Amphidinium_carterae.1